MRRFDSASSADFKSQAQKSPHSGGLKWERAGLPLQAGHFGVDHTPYYFEWAVDFDGSIIGIERAQVLMPCVFYVLLKRALAGFQLNHVIFPTDQIGLRLYQDARTLRKVGIS